MMGVWSSVPASYMREVLALFKRLVMALERIADAMENENRR